MGDSYLDRLIRKFEKRRGKLSEDFKRDLFDSEKVTDLLEQSIVKKAKELMPCAAKTIGMEGDELEKRLSEIHMSNGPEVNGFVFSSDEWKTFEITISLGLMMFFHKMIIIFASRSVAVPFWINGQPIEDPALVSKYLKIPKIQIEDIFPVARDLMEAFWEGDVLRVEHLPMAELDDNQIAICSALLSFAERFVVAHELGHAIIRISQRDVMAFDLGIETINFYLSKIRKMNERERDIVARGWGEEIGADIIGLESSLILANDDSSKALTYSAVELVFIMQKMLETYYQKTRGLHPPLGEHPPTRWRLNALRVLIKELSPPLFELGNQKASERIADSLLLKV